MLRSSILVHSHSSRHLIPGHIPFLVARALCRGVYGFLSLKRFSRKERIAFTKPNPKPAALIKPNKQKK